MKVFTRTFAVSIALLCALPALAAQQIKLVERPLGETTVDLGKKGDSRGDLLVFSNEVFDAANKVRVGSDQGYCVRITAGKSWECIWTLILKTGLITVEGPFMDDGDSLFAITGGTGEYLGAKGSMTLHPRDAKATSYDFTYDLL
jgi:allene oxide cyclase